MRRRSGAAVVAGVLSALFGCTGSESPAATTVTDSAGVRVVSHPLALTPPRWIAALDSAVVLDDVPGAPMFDIRAALRLRDGRYAVADGGNLRVILLAGTGVTETTTGRPGEGPGEFQHLTVLARWAADSLVVWDSRVRRLSVLAPSGAFARSFTLETTDDVPFASVTGVFDDGSLLTTGFVDTGGGGPESGRRMYTSPSFHFASDGRILAESGVFPTGESYFEVNERGFGVWPVLFGTQVFRRTAGDLMLVATSDRYELRLMAADGTLHAIVRREARARPVTAEARRVLTERLVGEARAGQEERMREVLTRMEVPELMPELSDVFADRLGRIWVREYEVPEPEAIDWRVYAADGSALAAVALPARFEPTDAGEDFVLGILTDELDVESVVEYPLLR